MAGFGLVQEDLLFADLLPGQLHLQFHFLVRCIGRQHKDVNLLPGPVDLAFGNDGRQVRPLGGGEAGQIYGQLGTGRFLTAGLR